MGEGRAAILYHPSKPRHPNSSRVSMRLGVDAPSTR